ncbi:DUF2199 domain-containing protein [Mucilaginibacter sp. SMC90]|uniref:DUF2199 domain-containing protein n=1 Tax=Mucilaginibacter sp. SMC90 TaxID=2929803 RepID=UPI001FB55C6A|nr:DUF2199 domain-containing protein [Mucilaginibacter sp. SMC90]UOE49573.1 DUF2199 domain-containing protein [Mucilaginibacter sp. SMC90]
MSYICSHCGKEHEEWPALTFDAPYAYYRLSNEDKNNIAELGSDHCIINYKNQTDLFIRATLIQKVNSHCNNLDYGIWVSLSEKSYNDYADNFDNENHITSYFGYLSNNIPGYEDTFIIHTTVNTRAGNERPEVVPHEGFEHPFVTDYYNGIEKDEAERRIADMLKSQ